MAHQNTISIWTRFSEVWRGCSVVQCSLKNDEAPLSLMSMDINWLQHIKFSGFESEMQFIVLIFMILIQLHGIGHGSAKVDECILGSNLTKQQLNWFINFFLSQLHTCGCRRLLQPYVCQGSLTSMFSRLAKAEHAKSFKWMYNNI